MKKFTAEFLGKFCLVLAEAASRKTVLYLRENAYAVRVGFATFQTYIQRTKP